MLPQQSTASERLNYMLNETAFGIKRGRIEKISKSTGYTRTAVGRWLNNDALPRDPEERLTVAKLLGVDLIYWEYGIEFPSLKNSSVNNASIYRAIFEVVDEKKYHDYVNDEDMDRIKDIITCATNQTFYNDLVELVQHLIELTVKPKK
jgi:hypothetical protein